MILCIALVITLIPALGTETASAAEVTNIEVLYDANKAPVNPLYKHNEWDDTFGDNNKAGAFSVSSEDYQLGSYATLLAKTKNSSGTYASVTGGGFSEKTYSINNTKYDYAIQVKVKPSQDNTIATVPTVTVKSPDGTKTYCTVNSQTEVSSDGKSVKITFKVPVDTTPRVANFKVEAEDGSGSVQQNTTQKFVTDNWKKSEDADTSVTWSVTGNDKSGATIDSSTGVLTVAADEPTTSRLKVRATCNAPAYSHLYAEKEVTVSERAPYIDRIEIKAIPEIVTSVGKGTT